MTITADCKFLSSAAVTNGHTLLQAAGATFAPGDVGMAIALPGHVTTIGDWVSEQEIHLYDAAPQTYSGAKCNYGTDNTISINNLLYQGTSVIDLPHGFILCDDINMTDGCGPMLRGAGWGLNGWGGTVIVPLGKNIVDCTATGGPRIQNIQLGTPKSAITPDTAMLFAQKAGSMASSLAIIDQVFAVGDFNIAPHYAYGVGDSVLRDTKLWNRIGTSKYTAIFTATDGDGVISKYQTLRTGTALYGRWKCTSIEYQDHKEAGGNTSGGAILIRRGNVYNEDAYVCSSSSNAAVRIESVDGGGCASSWTDTTFGTENGTNPAYTFDIHSGTYQCNFVGPCKWTYAAGFKKGSGAWLPNGNCFLSMT